MYSKAINDMRAGTGIYDFVYIEQDIIYSYLANNYLVNLTQMLADNPELASTDFDFAKFTSFIDNFKDADGNVFGVPMEAFVKPYLYRTDLFNDPAIKDSFKAEYGYDLAPATTHQQYQDIADFFTKYGQDNGLELWGSTVQGATGHSSSFYEFVETVAPTFGVYNWGINSENWKATVENGGEMNSDKAKQALAWWVGLLKDAPPEATASTWDEVAASFAAGRAAQGLVYGENTVWIATDPERSKVVGNVGVALPPLEDGVLDAAKAGTGYVGYYDGGAFGMPVVVQEPEVHAAVAPIHRPGIRAGRLGHRRLAYRHGIHLRRSQDQGSRRQGRQLLHVHAGAGSAVPRRAAVPVPCRHSLGRRTVHLAGTSRRNHAGRSARPGRGCGGCRTGQPRVRSVSVNACWDGAVWPRPVYILVPAPARVLFIPGTTQPCAQIEWAGVSSRRPSSSLSSWVFCRFFTSYM